jgi:hypothetical protein
VHERNALKAVLGSLGLVALLLYILACRASWSPDGSRVLFPYYNPETQEDGVALYDVRTGVVRSIFARPHSSSSDVVVQWESDGSRAIVSSGRSKYSAEINEILLLPLDATRPARQFRLPDGVSMLAAPYPEVAGKLYLGGDTLFVADLDTGELRSRKLEGAGDIVLFGAGDRVLYFQTKEATGSKGKEKESKLVEIGELDRKSLALRPLFDFRLGDLQVGGIEGLVFPASHGDRFAWTGWSDASEKGNVLVLFTMASLEKVIVPDFAAAQYMLGNLQWSLDGETIYAAVATPVGEEDSIQISVGAIPVAGGPARLFPIVVLEGDRSENDEGDYFMPFYQIALSPDGTTIAVELANLDFDGNNADKRGLYLLDIQSPKPTVRKIPIPPSAAGLKEDAQ